MSTSVHDDLEIRCGAELQYDDGETVLNKHGNPERCDATIRYEEHGTFLSSVPADLRDRYEAAVLKLVCPACGEAHYRCPICTDADGAPGWFRGESTGEMLACHNCNAQEAARQQMGRR
jgi:predicted RNA-binding Zn-ribbon protein involved in translation (DUF1610 family)